MKKHFYKLGKFLLCRKSYSYDFIAAPIIGAGVALAAENALNMGSCITVIINKWEFACTIVYSIHFIAVVFMVLGGSLIWILGRKTEITDDLINTRVENITLLEIDSFEKDNRIKRAKNEEYKNSSLTTIILFIFSIGFVILSIIMIGFSGILIKLFLK